jgi:antitoxin component YwqK of YwqJK toxin-antitoxin module
LYNLIPSCYTCNSKLKGTVEFKNLAPSSQQYDFDEKVKFKLKMSDSCHDLHIKNKNDIEVNLKENYSNDFKDFIEKMYLDERYKVHKDIAFDMIQKAELYPESRLKELQDLTGIPFQQIKKDIFNLIDENEDLSKKPFSKLIVDMSKELGLT